MKTKRVFCIKKLNIFLVCMIVTLSVLTGCSAGTPSASRVKDDLNASDIVGSKEFFGNNDVQMTPITKVSIVDKIVEGDECEIKCNVVFEDNNYRIESQVTAFYSKFDAWSFEKYEIGEFSIVPTSGVPNSIVKQRAEALVVSSVGSIVEDAYVTNVAHNFDKTAKTDYVTFDLSAKGYVSQMNMRVSAEYSFNDYWRVDEFTGEVIDYEWLYDDLVGTTWSGSVGIGATRTITFNSVDTANHTMNISYYSSTDDCSYELADYSGSLAIKVNLPNESFTDQMWILGNGSIRYGKPGGLGGMLGRRDDNKVNAQLIIGESEETAGSYDVQQTTINGEAGLPVIPIAVVVIFVIILVVIFKKKSKKSKSEEELVEYDEPKGEFKKISDEKTESIDEKGVVPESSLKDESRIRTTFASKPDESGATISSSDKTDGDWFKSAGDL